MLDHIALGTANNWSAPAGLKSTDWFCAATLRADGHPEPIAITTNKTIAQAVGIRRFMLCLLNMSADTGDSGDEQPDQLLRQHSDGELHRNTERRARSYDAYDHPRACEAPIVGRTNGSTGQ
jgi:hypothetical protein